MTDARPETKLQIRIVPVTPLQQNCSLIWDTATKHAVFVDPGGDVDTLIVPPVLMGHDHLAFLEDAVPGLAAPPAGPLVRCSCDDASRSPVARIAGQVA